jgi:hypothetical protein
MEAMDLTKKQQIELIFDYMQRQMFHNAIWFSKVREHLGNEKAEKLLKASWDFNSKLQVKKVCTALGLEIEDDLPKVMLESDDETISSLQTAMAKNWLAMDGIWFQTVEFSEDMLMAKKCNDEAWEQFSPFEAMRIKNILDLPFRAGLEGLKKALNYRLYADINVQSIANETENSFDFFMNECRVQQARQRKGLDDYPCKSAGIIEYTTFAQTIDDRITTSVISCPPDEHPKEYFCGWRFTLNE